VRLGLQIPSFTWPGGPEAIAEHLGRIVRTADDIGFDSIWVMDHLIQIRGVGKPSEPMLEGWTTLGWIAANTRRARLGLLVGAVPYRQPAVWIKAATALDVLSGGRAWFGIGAACVGAAGALVAPILPFQPTTGLSLSVTSFNIVIIGGMGSLVGAFVGGLLVSVAESLGAVFLKPSLKELVSFSLLVLILLLRPAGLFGRRAA